MFPSLSLEFLFGYSFFGGTLNDQTAIYYVYHIFTIARNIQHVCNLYINDFGSLKDNLFVRKHVAVVLLFLEHMDR